MSQVKISELPSFSIINANTANTLFVGVDIPTSATFKMTAHTLAQGLYSNEVLVVGQNTNPLPNTIGQFSASGESYIQTNLVNTNDGGSADIVVTANVGSGGTDSTNFIDMGYANKNYQPGSEFNNIGNAINPKDGYLYVQGTSGGNGGNLIIGTTTSNTELRFIAGGGTAANVVAKMTSAGLTMNTGTTITFADGSTQKVAASPANYSQAAFALANTVSSNTVINQGVDVTQNTNISLLQGAIASANANIASLFAIGVTQNTSIGVIQGVDTTQNTTIQTVWNLANTALQNTINIITSKDLSVTGNITVLGIGAAGLFTINAVPYVANTPAFKITGSANTGYSQVPLNQGYMLQVTGFANTSSRIVNDAFGANSYPAYVGRSARGSAISPSATANGDVLLRLSGNGWSNNFSQFGQSRIDFVAAENFTDTTKGTQIQFWNTKIGSNTLNQIAVFNSETATFVGNVNPTKGFIYTPNVYPSSQTAITIDFANNSIVRAQTSSGLVVSMSNYTIGKIVEVWITNTAGTNQTYTTGVPAINSTINATTYNIPSTSTICARYFCVDGTLGNTLVSVIHA